MSVGRPMTLTPIQSEHAPIIWIGKRNDQFTDFDHSFFLQMDCFGPYPLFEKDGNTVTADAIGNLARSGLDILWYDELWGYALIEEGARIPIDGLNDRDLLVTLGNKHRMRELDLGVTAIDGAVVPRLEANYHCARELFPESHEFIFHGAVGSACSGVRRLYSIADNHVIDDLSGEYILITPLVRNAIPCNIHILINRKTVVVFPPSLQLLTPQDSGLIHFSGCDFSALASLDCSSRGRIQDFGNCIAEQLSKLGYRGICGVDFLLTSGTDCLLVEINARFQASTGLINRTLGQQLGPSLQQLHLCTRLDIPLPKLSMVSIEGAISIPSAAADGLNPKRLAHTSTIVREPYGIFPAICPQTITDGVPL